MKIKTLVAAVLLLSGGATSVFAQNDCNANSSISHEAVNAKNYKDAYAPCMAVLKECPTLRYYTFLDAIEILQNFLQTNKDRNSADYKKYFDELMGVHDLRIKYIPEFLAKGTKLSISVNGAVGAKAIDYLAYAPSADVNQAYAWLSQSVQGDKGESRARFRENRLAAGGGRRIGRRDECEPPLAHVGIYEIHHAGRFRADPQPAEPNRGRIGQGLRHRLELRHRGDL